MSIVSIERGRYLNPQEKPPAFVQVEKTVEKIQEKAFNFFEQRGGPSRLRSVRLVACRA
jgi:hypothetical protein